jgi:L-amino acid N-acyltransferase YncA
MCAVIRIATESDAGGIVDVYGPYCDATVVSFETAAPTTEQMRERIRNVLEYYPWLVAEVDGRVAGYVYASRHRERAAYRWAVDVAVYIAAARQRCGIGRALYSALLAILREQGYFQACAGITLPNSASVGLHEHMGFRPCAVFRGVGFKLNQWLDVGWWQVELRPAVAEPPEPSAFSEFRESSIVKTALADGTRDLAGKFHDSSRSKA